MKKTALFLVTLLLSMATASAQWVRPVPEFSDIVVDGSTIQYLYNVEAGGFLLGANNWETRASISQSKGYKMMFSSSDEAAGTGNLAIAVGMTLTNVSLQDYAESTPTGTMWTEYDCSSWNQIWCDGAGREGAGQWIITAISEQRYNISNAYVEDLLFGWAPYAGDSTNTRCWMLDFTQTDEESGALLFDKTKACTTWAVVSEADYQTWLPKMQTYEAAMALGSYISNAEANYSEINLSSPKAVYNNGNATVGQLETALYQAKQIVFEYRFGNMTEGTVCTEMLENPALTDGLNGWTYYNETVGGLMDYPCAEVYQKVVDFSQTVSGIPSGLYAITVKAFERPANNGSYNGTEISKTQLFCNELQTPVQNILKGALPESEAVDGENCYLTTTSQPSSGSTNLDYLADGQGYIPNSMVGASIAFGADRYSQTFYGLVDNNRTMTVGLTSEGQTVHWALWSGFQITYMAQNKDALNACLTNQIDILMEYVENNGGNMNGWCLNKTENIIDAANEALDGSESELWQTVTTTNAAIKDVKANMAAMTTYNQTLEQLDETLNSYGNEATKSAVSQAEEAMSEAGDVEELSTEEIILLTEKMKKAITALKTPAYEQATMNNPVNMTALIVNPTFDTIGDFTGWSEGFSTGGTTSTNAECYNKNFNVHQTITGLPAGLYRVGVQGFYRQGNYLQDYDANVAKTREPSFNATIYATNSSGETVSAPIMNACRGMVTEPLGGGTAVVGDEYYIPNTMEAANYWFEAGYYLPDTTYNAVFITMPNDGDLTIGVRKDVTLTSDWAIFDNFSLLYYGTGEATETDSIYSQPTNADFMSDAPEKVGIRTFTKDLVGNGDKANAQAVTDWTLPDNGDALAGGIFAYGSSTYLGGDGIVPPSTAPNGSKGGQALGLVAGWSKSIVYTQKVALSAGTHTLYVALYNAQGTDNMVENLIGANGTYAKKSHYDTGRWMVETVTFTATQGEPTTLSLGYTAQNGLSTNMPHLFIDRVTIDEEISLVNNPYEPIAGSGVNTVDLSSMGIDWRNISDEEFAAVMQQIDWANVEALTIPENSTERITPYLSKAVSPKLRDLVVLETMLPVEEMQKVDYGANVMVRMPEGTTPIDASGNIVPAPDNVFIGGKAERVVLTDRTPYVTGYSYKGGNYFANQIVYTRTFGKSTRIGQSSGWEALVVPFNVAKITAADGRTLAPFGSTAQADANFWLAELTEDGFQPATRIEAGLPYIIAMPNSEEYDAQYNITGDVTFSATNDSLYSSLHTLTQGYNGMVFTPNYYDIAQTDATDMFTLNDETYQTYLPGGAFVRGLRAVRPFEAYVRQTSRSKPRRVLPIVLPEPTALYQIAAEKGQKTDGVIYDLTGRRVKAPTHGLYIRDGKKILVK